MKNFLSTVLVGLVLSLAPVAFAADEGAGATHAGRGRVKSINAEAQSLRMEHEPIASLKWPAMTMNFKAHDAALLQGLKPEMEVDFELAKFGSRYEITRIAPAAR